MTFHSPDLGNLVDPASINMDRLNAIIVGSGSSGAEFLIRFRQSNAMDARLLSQAAGAMDFARSERLAHRIRGASTMLGAAALSDACTQIGQACAVKDSTLLTPAVHNFEQEMASLETLLSTLIHAVPGLLPTSVDFAERADYAAGICSGLKFLAVEDHEVQLGILVEMLVALGASDVCCAPDGRAAMNIVLSRNEPVDIIISDLDMPDMDGMEFMRHLGQAGTPVSVILASALDGSLVASVETMSKAYGVRVLGVIEKPVTPEKLEALIALHRAVVPSSRDIGTAGTVFTVEDIVRGLEHDEFEAFFQPKVDLMTGRVTGAEALARWRLPHSGVVVPPSAFIEIMEANGLIDALTWTMLNKAAQFCAQWRQVTGADVTVSVNLSMKSLVDPHLAERVIELVQAANLSPWHMVLELTESAATADVGQMLENLSRLRMKGFGLSIDDYGTGYSSVQQLARIAFTELKIDQYFVANALHQESSRVILEASLNMARKLKIISVAEGVETQEGWDLLRDLGCELAQGFFIAKPMDREAFLVWVRERDLAVE